MKKRLWVTIALGAVLLVMAVWSHFYIPYDQNKNIKRQGLKAGAYCGDTYLIFKRLPEVQEKIKSWDTENKYKFLFYCYIGLKTDGHMGHDFATLIIDGGNGGFFAWLEEQDVSTWSDRDIWERKEILWIYPDARSHMDELQRKTQGDNLQ